MLHCWNEDPLQRPTFTELRDHLEEIMSQGCHYMSFDIDEKNAYYNVASYNSVPDENEDDIEIEEAILQKPPQFLSIEDLKKEREEKSSTGEQQDLEIKLPDIDPDIWDIDEKINKPNKKIESNIDNNKENRYTKTSELLQNANLGIL